MLALVSVPHSYAATEGRKGDVRIVDVTNPRRPRELADWDVRRDGPGRRPPGATERGGTTSSSPTAWPATTAARRPSSRTGTAARSSSGSPIRRGRATWAARAFPRGAFGNAHSGAFSEARASVFVQNDEVGDFYHSGIEGAWGFQRIWDVSNPARPGAARPLRHRELGPRARRAHSPRRLLLRAQQRLRRRRRGRLLVLGRRPDRRPLESAPPAPRRPLRPAAHARSRSGSGSRRTATAASRSSGASRSPGGLVYASDINSGLWIFRSNAIAGTAGDRDAAGTIAPP